MIGGQVGINGHIKIAEGTKIAAQSGVSKSVKQSKYNFQGTPAFHHRRLYQKLCFVQKFSRTI